MSALIAGIAKLGPALLTLAAGNRKDGQVLSKGILTSKTMNGGNGLLVIVVTGFLPGAIAGDWFSRIMLILAIACYGLVWYGRKRADLPLGKD